MSLAPTIEERTVSTFVELNNGFHEKMFNKLFDEKRDSMVYSPYSVNFIMTMLYRGMDGETREEFERVYGLHRDSGNLIQDFVKFDRTIQHKNLMSANAIFVDNQYRQHIKKDYLDRISDAARFSLKGCDFRGNHEEERDRINEWVSNNTNGLIEDLLANNSLSEETKSVLVNTLYLKMKWSYPFSRSFERDFTRLDGTTKKVDMMAMDHDEYMQYYENDSLQMLMMPYRMESSRGSQFSMGIVLPRKGQEFSLTSTSDVEDMIGKVQFHRESVNVHVPKFTTEFSVDLVDMYKEFGMETLFDDFNCNLGRLTSKNDLVVSNIIHKAKIIVDETGTEAAAATAVEMCLGESASIKEPKDFIANRTFQYFIVHNQTKTILFSGVYN